MKSSTLLTVLVLSVACSLIVEARKRECTCGGLGTGSNPCTCDEIVVKAAKLPKPVYFASPKAINEAAVVRDNLARLEAAGAGNQAVSVTGYSTGSSSSSSVSGSSTDSVGVYNSGSVSGSSSDSFGGYGSGSVSGSSSDSVSVYDSQSDSGTSTGSSSGCGCGKKTGSLDYSDIVTGQTTVVPNFPPIGDLCYPLPTDPRTGKIIETRTKVTPAYPGKIQCSTCNPPVPYELCVNLLTGETATGGDASNLQTLDPVTRAKVIQLAQSHSNGYNGVNYQNYKGLSSGGFSRSSSSAYSTSHSGSLGGFTSGAVSGSGSGAFGGLSSGSISGSSSGAYGGLTSGALSQSSSGAFGGLSSGSLSGSSSGAFGGLTSGALSRSSSGAFGGLSSGSFGGSSSGGYGRLLSGSNSGAFAGSSSGVFGGSSSQAYSGSSSGAFGGSSSGAFSGSRSGAFSRPTVLSEQRYVYPGTGQSSSSCFDDDTDLSEVEYSQPEIPADAVSLTLAYKNLHAPNVIYRQGKKFVPEDKLSFGHRTVPSDVKPEKKHPDIPEEKLLTIDRPVVELKLAPPKTVVIGSYDEREEAKLAELEAIERESITQEEAAEQAESFLSYKDLGYAPVGSVFARAQSRSDVVTDDRPEEPCGPMGPPVPGYVPGSVVVQQEVIETENPEETEEVDRYYEADGSDEDEDAEGRAGIIARLQKMAKQQGTPSCKY